MHALWVFVLLTAPAGPAIIVQNYFITVSYCSAQPAANAHHWTSLNPALCKYLLTAQHKVEPFHAMD